VNSLFLLKRLLKPLQNRQGGISELQIIRDENMSKRLIEVVPPLPPEVAKKAFEQWRLENRRIAISLKAEDIITDYIRAANGRTLVRYQVVLEKMGLVVPE
jgi:hypothetical protein